MCANRSQYQTTCILLLCTNFAARKGDIDGIESGCQECHTVHQMRTMHTPCQGDAKGVRS